MHGRSHAAKTKSERSDAARSACLLGAAEREHRTGHSLEDRFESDIIPQLRHLLGEQAFLVAWVQGQAMSLDETVRYAIEELPRML